MKHEMKEMFKDGLIGVDERGFLEDLLEAIPLVADREDTGNTIEYYDEYGSTLFCVDIVGEKEYLFRFYDNAYPVSEDVMQKVRSILAPSESA